MPKHVMIPAPSVTAPSLEDELELALNSDGAASDPFADELEATTELSDYDLTGANEMDIRPLTHKTWYDAVISSCQRALSGAGNPQFNIILRVVDAVDPSQIGTTVFDQVPTPNLPMTPKKVQSLWKLKALARCCGLAELNVNGEATRVKSGTKPSDFVGKRLRFRNIVDDKYDPENPRNKVDAYSCAAG